MRWEIIGIFIIKQIEKPRLCSVLFSAKHPGSVDLSRRRENTQLQCMTLVFLYTSFVLCRFLGAVQQNKAQSS